MTKNLNINPYYDDFDEAKNYHQILFRPGYSVQARELTQIQSILKNQIAKFGDHVFKHGSVVIPGNSSSDLYAPFIKVSDLLGGSIDLLKFRDQIIVGETSGVKAIVKFAVERDAVDPYVLYVAYVSGGTAGEIIFEPGEIVHLELDTAVKVAILPAVDSMGAGSLAQVNDGVYYVNGTFAHVSRQTVVIDKFSSTPTARVMLRIDESFVTSNDDDTLLDPAQGSYNYAAPGADRLKIDLTLVVVPVDSVDSADYIELMRFRNGEMEEHSRYPKYSELEKSLARRTYDESGNYVVNGFDVIIKENKKVGKNNGDSPTGDANKLTYLVTPGKAYNNGFEVEMLTPKKLVVDKARTPAHVIQTTSTIKPTYGQFFLVSNPTGKLNTDARETLQLWNDSDVSGGSQIGTAKVVAIDYYTGDGINPIYKLFVTEVNLTSGSYEDIGSIRTATPFNARVVAEVDAFLNSGTLAIGEIINFNTGARTATVSLYRPIDGKLYYHKHDGTKPTPKVGDMFVGASGGASALVKNKRMIHSNGQSGVVFPLSTSAVKTLKNASNAFDMTVVVHRRLFIAEGATSATISGGTFVAIEAGTFIAITNSGVDDSAYYSIDGTGTVVSRSSPAPVGGVTIFAQSNNTGIPRTKNIQTSSPISKTSSNVITLDHTDVFEIISVIGSGVDIKNSYTLDNGATDYEYGLSKLILKNGVTPPVGNVTITYRYFNHTSGDFFSVDSYVGINIDEIPSYRSPTTGEFRSLRDCIDFRKTVGINSNVIVSDTNTRTSVQIYTSRIDSICIDHQKKITVISGTPAENPKPPLVPSDLYELERILIPAYTFSVQDIRRQRMASHRYTMSDIGEIEYRIDRLEDFSTLTALESELIKTEIIDAATGLDRYKTGYVVEDMTDPFGLADSFNVAFRSSMNSSEGIMPLLEAAFISIGLAGTSTGFQYTGGVISLPYTETPFARQVVSSRTTNLNPFMLIKWEGLMYLTPPKDNWVEIIDLPEIVINREVVQTVIVTIWEPAPPVVSPTSTPSWDRWPEDFLPPERLDPLAPGGFRSNLHPDPWKSEGPYTGSLAPGDNTPRNSPRTPVLAPGDNNRSVFAPGDNTLAGNLPS